MAFDLKFMDSLVMIKVLGSVKYLIWTLIVQKSCVVYKSLHVFMIPILF